MGIVIRQSAWATIITYLGVGIGYINILILFPKYMSPEEVGLVRIIQDAAMLMVPIAQLGVSQMTLRFFPEYKDTKNFQAFINLILLFTVVALSIFSLAYNLLNQQIINFFSAQSPRVVFYLGTILLLIWIMSVHQLLVALSNSLLNIVLPNFLKEVWLRFLTFLALILFALRIIDFDQFIVLLVGSYALNLLIIAIYLLQKRILNVKVGLGLPSKHLIAPMIRYALITFLGASGILIVGKVDSLMVTGMLGLSENAIYTTAFYIAVLIELPKRAVAQISTPLISRSFEVGNLQEVKAIYQKSALNNLIIGLLIFIGLWINLENLYTLVPNSKIYSVGSMVVLIVGFGKLFDMASGVNGEIIIMSRHYKVNVYLIVLLASVTILANYILIPIYGLIGAAVGSAIALLAFNIAKFSFLIIKMKIQPFSQWTFVTLLIGLLVLIIGIYLPPLNNVYVDILYRSAVVTTVYGALVYVLKVSPEINSIIDKVIGRRN
jgi:O-antigen/teichoic acid export membrane protein